MKEKTLALISRKPLLLNMVFYEPYLDNIKKICQEKDINLINIVFTNDDESSINIVHIDENNLPMAGITFLNGSLTTTEAGLIRNLEIQGMKILNSPYSHSIGGNKFLSYMELANKNIPIPKTIGITFSSVFRMHEIADTLITKLSLPIVIKKTNWALGCGIMQVNNKRDLIDLLGIISSAKTTDFFDIPNFEFVAQEFIPDNPNKKIRVIVLNDKCISSIMKETYSYWKINPDGNRPDIVSIYPMTDILNQICIDTCRALNLNYAGLDLFILNDGSYMIGEVNPFPMLRLEYSTIPNYNLLEQIIEYLIPHDPQ